MKPENYIALKTFCRQYQIEESFIQLMHEYELIHIECKQGESFVLPEQLPLLEKMVRLHQELHINPEGIQAVYQLLQHVEALQQQISRLQRKLDRYEK